MVSSTDGGSTITGWNRRSRAASFSMCLRYSSRVVAPIIRSSPRASIGFSMLDASMAPSAAPAPTRVCISSRNVMIPPSAALISSSTALSRSSNSPRYLAPATIEPRSRATMRLLSRPVGTSPSTIREASPSAMAVLPTPGSPMSSGLFLVRRLRTWMTRRISSSRPITGSSFPSAARATRSRPYLPRASSVSSGSWLVTFRPPRTLASTSRIACSVIPTSARAVPAAPVVAARASIRCSTETYWSPIASACEPACSRTATVCGANPASAAVCPCTRGIRSRERETASRSSGAPAPRAPRSGWTMVSPWSIRAARRCSGVTCWWLRETARSRAAVIACCARLVKRLMSIGIVSGGGGSKVYNDGTTALMPYNLSAILSTLRGLGTIAVACVHHARDERLVPALPAGRTGCRSACRSVCGMALTARP